MAFPKIEGYIVTEKLGSGSYSTVYKAYTKVGARTVVAIKCVDKSRVKQSGAAIDNLVTEIRLLKTLAHPHIVLMKHFTWDDRNIYIIMEYCSGGDLSKYIRRCGRVPENQVLYFLQQLCSALKFLREKGVAHMDLKPHNLLLHRDSDGKHILKLADFGFAQYMRSEARRAVRGSPLYMAPEVLRGDYTASCDLWSLGVIMYECLFGRAPYSSSTFAELVAKIQSQHPIEIPANSSISPGCSDLLSRLLQHDPAQRITYDELFEHPYLDLEYMPSKENYDKGVSLIQQAIAQEAEGRAAAALALYGAALRRLLPAARHEPCAARRAALRAKLARYMERAEALQQYLKDPTAPAPPVPPAPPAARTPPPPHAPPRRDVTSCCRAQVAASTNSYDFTAYQQAALRGDAVRGAVDEPASPQPADPSPPPPPLPPPPHPGGGSGGGGGGGKDGGGVLRRLFGRSNSTQLPYVTDSDSSISAAAPGGPRPSDDSDACRIA